jgi:Zn-dependent protease
MHDPFAWSFPLGRLFGVTVRIHWLFPFVALGVILHAAYGKPYPDYVPPPGLWIDASILVLLLFLSVLWHEYAHCFAGRAVGGEASEILMWPLGGLANVDLPHRPRAHFLCAAAGPVSNLLLCALCVLALLVLAERPLTPSWSPLHDGWPARGYPDTEGRILVKLHAYHGDPVYLDPLLSPAVWAARLFWVNWFLALFNIVLIGFPLDGGRMLQATLWPHVGYRHSMLASVYCGFAVAAVVGLYAIVTNSVLSLGLALFIMDSCRRQWMLLESGGEEGIFGYDFSQGYTSLERGSVDAPPRARVSWWQRWTQRRAARRLLRELEQREAEERRLDELLDKVHRQGRASLTPEEERFMKRVSGRYRR